MAKKIYLTVLLAIAGMANVNAQMRISGSEMPNESAVLDLNPDNNVSSGNATLGLALPRVNLNNSGDAFPLSAHVKGMSVYNMATVDDVTPGVYVNDGEKWLRQLDGEDWKTFWQSGRETFEYTVTVPDSITYITISPEPQYFTSGMYWCNVQIFTPIEVYLQNMFYSFMWYNSIVYIWHEIPGVGRKNYRNFSFPVFLESSMDTYPIFHIDGLPYLTPVTLTLTMYRIL